MPVIQLYEIDNNYIDYLRQFDSKVLNHSAGSYTNVIIKKS